MPNPRLARRRRKSQVQKRKKLSSKFIFVGIIILSISALVLVLVWFLLPANWDSEKRLTVVAAAQSGDVSVLIFSPETQSISEIAIPSSTQIQVSRQLGVYKIGNIYKLGMQENLGGKLLAESITKSLKLPIDEWSNQDLIDLKSLSLSSSLKTVFSNYQTSLKLKDRIKLAMFSLRVKPSRFNQIDLQDLGYLMPSTLKDGEEGFIARFEPPLSLSTYFADPDLVSARIAIYDATDSNAIAPQLGQVIEMLGGKVFAVYDRETSDQDCTIRTSKADAAAILASLLDCEVEKRILDSGFDIEIFVGKDFRKRF